MIDHNETIENFTNLDGIENGELSAQCLMVDFDIIMKARLQFLKTKAFLEPITIFSVHRIPETI